MCLHICATTYTFILPLMFCLFCCRAFVENEQCFMHLVLYVDPACQSDNCQIAALETSNIGEKHQ